MIDDAKKELIIFDLDGTILDTLDDLADSLNYSLAFHGFSPRTREEVRKFVGNGIRNLIERALPAQTSGDIAQTVFRTFIDYYKLHCFDKTKPYAGIPELLQKLKEKGYLLAVISNKADAVVQKLCLRYFDGLFDYAAGERTGIPKKPAPDSVLAVMEIFHKNAEATLYIGDSEVDIKTAQNAGIDCLSVTWGFRDALFLKQQGAKKLAHSAADTMNLITDTPFTRNPV